MNTVKHIALAEAKAGDIEQLVTPFGNSSRARLGRFFRQTQQPGERTPALQPSAGIDLGLSVIVEGGSTVFDIEAETFLSERQTPLVPEAAAHGHVSGAELLDLKTALPGPGAVEVLLPERFVGDIAAIDIGHDVGDPCLGGGGDYLALCGGRSTDGKGDNEELLTTECGDEGFVILVLVVDLCDLDAGWKSAGTGRAGQGCDGVVAGFK